MKRYSNIICSIILTIFISNRSVLSQYNSRVDALAKINFLTHEFDSTTFIDSVIVWRNDGTQKKTDYNYTEDGKREEIVSYVLSEGGWSNQYRDVFSYDPKGNTTSRLSQIWEAESWENTNIVAYQYNDMGNKTQTLYQIWENNEWQNRLRHNNAFDEQGYLDSVISNKWENDDWLTYNIDTYTFDGNGNLIIRTQGEWGRRIYAYDSNGNRISNTFQINDGGNWKDQIRKTYYYDTNGNLVHQLEQEFVDNNWIDEMQLIMEYDVDNNRISLTQEKLRDSIWLSVVRYIYTYDVNGNNLIEFHQIYEENKWKNENIVGYTYDDMNNVIESYYRYWVDGEWAALNGPMGFQDSFGKYYAFSGTNLSVYYSLVANVDVEDHVSIPDKFDLYQNYPNPFNPTTKISYSIKDQSHVSLKVFDVLGREIASLVNKEQPVGNYSIEFDASNLTSGIYFYRIQAGDYMESKKMVLLK